MQNQVLDQFTASASKPSAPANPRWVNIIAVNPADPKHPKVVGSELHWNASNGGTDPISYSVELLDTKGWQTIGVGLSQPTITLSPAQTLSAGLSGLRVTATNGFVNSDPLLLPSNSKP